MTINYLPCVEVNPRQLADAAVIWLHGLGADGHDFELIVPELKLPESAAIRFIFPHAPAIPVTINSGMVMPAWYDIVEADIAQQVDEKGLLNAAAKIADLIDREIERKVDSSRIVIVGFSQGGAVGYQVALTYPQPLAGLIAMSSYVAGGATVSSQTNSNLPVQIYHGTLDPVVPEALGQAAYSMMRELGCEVNYQTYPMQHQVCAEQISDISAWLQSLLLQ